MVIGSNIVLFILYLSLVTSEPVNVMLYSEMYIIIPFSRSDGSYKNLSWSPEAVSSLVAVEVHRLSALMM